MSDDTREDLGRLLQFVQRRRPFDGAAASEAGSRDFEPVDFDRFVWVLRQWRITLAAYVDMQRSIEHIVKTVATAGITINITNAAEIANERAKAEGSIVELDRILAQIETRGLNGETPWPSTARRRRSLGRRPRQDAVEAVRRAVRARIDRALHGARDDSALGSRGATEGRGRLTDLTYT